MVVAILTGIYLPFTNERLNVWLSAQRQKRKTTTGRFPRALSGRLWALWWGAPSTAFLGTRLRLVLFGSRERLLFSLLLLAFALLLLVNAPRALLLRFTQSAH